MECLRIGAAAGGILEKQGENNLPVIVKVIIIIICIFASVKLSEILLKKCMWQISYQRILNTLNFFVMFIYKRK